MKIETRHLTKEEIEANPKFKIPIGVLDDEILEVICDGEVLCYLYIPVEELKSCGMETPYGLNFVTGGHYF